MPVRRSGCNNFVDQMVEAFRANESLIIAILPEGTRRNASHWKTGFYYIALSAGVPIVLGYADYCAPEDEGRTTAADLSSVLRPPSENSWCI